MEDTAATVDCDPDSGEKEFQEWLSTQSQEEDFVDITKCPPHLRVHFGLMLLDADFNIACSPYTPAHHRGYLDAMPKSELDHQMTNFVRGPGGRYFQLNQNLEPPTATGAGTVPLHVPQQYYVMPCPPSEAPNTSSQSQSTPKTWTFHKYHYKPSAGSTKRKHGDSISTGEDGDDEEWRRTSLSALQQCSAAISVLTHKERYLEEGGLFSAKHPHLTHLEDVLLTMATYPDSTSGIFYMISFQFEDDPIVYTRYFESGEYSGFWKQHGCHMLRTTQDDSVSWQVYNEEDIKTRTQMEYMKKKSRASRAKKKDRRTHRPDHTYENNISGNAKSVQKTIIKLCDQIAATGGVTLKALAVYCSPAVQDSTELTQRVKQNPYLHVVNMDSDATQAQLRAYPVIGRVPSSPPNAAQFLHGDLQVGQSIGAQAAALNSLPNMCWKEGGILRYEKRFLSCKSSPQSSRLAIIWAMTCNNQAVLFKTIRNLLYGEVVVPPLPDHLQESDTSTVEALAQPPMAKRKVLTVSKSCVARAVSASKDAAMPVAPNMLDMNTSLYENYKKQLVTNGTVMWRKRTDQLHVVLMNSYSSENGRFEAGSYVLVSALKTDTGGFVYSCQCDIHRSIQETSFEREDGSTVVYVDGMKCCHCRFFAEEVIPTLHNIGSGGYRATTFVEKKIVEGLNGATQPILKLPGTTPTTMKYSVMASDEISLVNLTRHDTGQYIVSCQSGLCKTQMAHKKSVQLLDTAQDLCPHLQLLKEHPGFLELEDSACETSPEEECIEKIFDTESGLYTFPCLSGHGARPDGDQYLARCIQARDQYTDNHLPREDGCLKGPDLVAPIPSTTCQCKAGWTDANHPSGQNTPTGQTTVMYTTLAPVRCRVCIRVCVRSVCQLNWDMGLSDCLHVLSPSTCAGDEIGWLFVSRVLSCGQTFTAFCQEMTQIYRRRNPNSRAFMSTPVFLNWWYSWAANQKLDFRKPCPVCKYSPKRLACDGTHIGITLKNVTCPPIKDLKNTDTILPTHHRRNQRCFLAISESFPKSAKSTVRECREHLSYFCQKAEGKIVEDNMATEDTEEQWAERLKDNVPPPTKTLFERFFSGTMPSSERKAFVSVGKMLATTMPLMALLPLRYARELLTLIQQINTNHPTDTVWVNDSLDRMRTYAPELHHYLIAAKKNVGTVPQDCIQFVAYICNAVLNTTFTDPSEAEPIEASYNPPELGRAYYFNPTGSQLRKCRKFEMDQTSETGTNNYDDEPTTSERCSKIYPKVSGKGSCYTFFWFCPTHHHCYGFHIINGSEGRKDPADSLYSHLENAPDEIFYDFACGFQEYVLNRESGYFKHTRIFHDIFHGYSHKCSKAYKSSRLQSLESVNSEICEQFNSFMQCIKRSATQMSQPHFVFYLQFFIHQWNQRKEQQFRHKLQVALLGAK